MIFRLDREIGNKCILTDLPRLSPDSKRTLVTLNVKTIRDERKKDAVYEYWTLLVWGELADSVLNAGLQKDDAIRLYGGNLKQKRYNDKSAKGYVRDVLIDVYSGDGHKIEFLQEL